MRRLPSARTLLALAFVAGAALSTNAGARERSPDMRARSLAQAQPQQTVAFTSSPPATAVVAGPTYTPTASTGSSGGAVTFAIDPATTNGACTLQNGVVYFVNAGSCVIDADASGAAPAQQTITVSAAGTATALTVGATNLSAQVGALAPSDGTPSGTVVFSVEGRTLGSATLTAGAATLAYAVPADITETLTASYTGSSDYASSSASQTVTGPTVEQAFVVKPTIRAVLRSRLRRNRRGWWHTIVRVRFVCDRAGSMIAGGCPKPVVIRHSVRNGSLTRSIRTIAGASASVTVRHIRIDLGAPHVRVVGVRRDGHYRTLVHARCLARDRISGIVSCRLHVHVRRGAARETVTYTATAISGAGVVRSTSVTAYVSG